VVESWWLGLNFDSGLRIEVAGERPRFGCLLGMLGTGLLPMGSCARLDGFVGDRSVWVGLGGKL
jgi:hypothetical protein